MRLFLFAFIAIAAAPISAQTATAPTAVVSTVDYERMLPAAGAWTYAPIAAGSVATFSDSSARPQLTLTCSRSTRRITLARPATGAAPFLFVWTSASTRNLPASFDPATNRLSAAVATTDPILDGIASSRGRFAVGMSSAPALIVPAWPETARVIEDCRS